MHPTRQAIMQALRRAGSCTVSDLATVAGISHITVRHHLNRLQAEGLVAVEEKRQPIGRPVYHFRLTEAGKGQFPQQYSLLVRHLLDELKQSLPLDRVDALIGALAGAMAADIRQEFASLTAGERMERLIAVLTREGVTAQWQQGPDGLRLVEYHCPYYLVGQQHPELCQIDAALIRTALDAEVERRTCLLAGDTACTYVLYTG